MQDLNFDKKEKNTICGKDLTNQSVTVNRDGFLNLMEQFLILKARNTSVHLNLISCINHDFPTQSDKITLFSVEDIKKFMTFLKHLHIEKGTIEFKLEENFSTIVFESKERYVATLQLKDFNFILKSIAKGSISRYLNCNIAYFINGYKRINISFSKFLPMHYLKVFSTNIEDECKSEFDLETYTMLSRCNLFTNLKNMSYIDISLLSLDKIQKIELKFFN